MSGVQSRVSRVCIVQPILSNYSLPVFLELAQYCEVDLFFSRAPKEAGFGEPRLQSLPNLRYFLVDACKPLGDWIGIYQRGLLGYIFRQRPDALLLSANLRELSFWGAVLCGSLLSIPVYAHGHGPYKKKRIGVVYRACMRMLLRLVTSYICYAPAVRQSFIDFGFEKTKLTVAHNSLVNPRPVPPEEKTGHEKGILFLGRLRQGSRLEWLVSAMARLRLIDGFPLSLHVIGAGEESGNVRERARNYPWIFFYGELYDAAKIREVSLHCFAGCYPGNAGLSVVHLMSLSLPVITHDQLHEHGPEASFIRNGSSGLLYAHADPRTSIYRTLRSLVSDPAKIARVQIAAFADYQALSHPSLAARLWAILRTPPEGPTKSFFGRKPLGKKFSSAADREAVLSSFEAGSEFEAGS